MEGIGDHGCEYMTGGRVVILGETGRNFGAGMSGGIAYVWDPNLSFSKNFNGELSDLIDLDTNSNDSDDLREIIRNHYIYTNSTVAGNLLNDWKSRIKEFKKVLPREYASILQKKGQGSPDYANT